MASFRSMMDVNAAEWLETLHLDPSDVPDVVIVEGSWWRAQRTKWRLSYLDEVRELAVPDVFWGLWQGKKVAYCCAYAAARTSEIIHIFGSVGASLAVQIGTCGGLQPRLQPGDVVVPASALCREGVAQLYGAVEATTGSAEWGNRARQQLSERDLTSHQGKHVTWSALFTETADLMQAWHDAGYLSVDMETATTFAVARHFGMSAVSLLVVWDDLTRGRSFLDPLSDREQQALHAANTAVYEVALALVKEICS